MYHQGTVEGSAVRLASLLGLASIGLLGLAVPAGAAGLASTAGAAGLAGSASTSPVDYSCSLAGYGQGLAPLTVPATLSARSTGVTVTVNLVTQPVQLPAATASALPQLSYLGIAGTAPASATVGTPEMLMLSAPASALGSAFPASATPVSASALAGLGGTGSVPLTGLADTGNGMFRLTGPWMPRKAGMVRIFAPHRFAARLREQTAVMVSVACAAATATTTTTQVMVQAAATMADPASPSAPAAAAGAPDTGGGGSLHPRSDLPLVAGGAAAVLAGLGITLYTLRRRRGVTG